MVQSMTKNLAKRLPDMTAADKADMLRWLMAEREVTKNPCVRASLGQRIRMVEQQLSLLTNSELLKLGTPQAVMIVDRRMADRQEDATRRMIAEENQR